jgi:hypothetical protein
MSNIELLGHINQRDCKISTADLFNGNCDKLVDRGLRVLTICNDGTGRSAVTANHLTNHYSIPSVRLDLGLKQFIEDEDLINSYMYAQVVVNRIPNVAIILLPDEVKRYYKIISGFRASIYKQSSSAIESIYKMES